MSPRGPRTRGRSLLLLLIGLGMVLLGCTGQPDADQSSSEAGVEVNAPEIQPPRIVVGGDSVETDVPYVPTPQPVVDRMLEMADLDEEDVVYDLGSGDGRIVIRAAQKYGSRGIGIEIDPARVEAARENARAAGVSGRVDFRQGNLFEADFSDATAVTLYLLPDVNRRLRPMLFEQLAPGTPVVSHGFDMGEWAPEATDTVNANTVYRWTIPEEVPPHLRESETDTVSR